MNQTAAIIHVFVQLIQRRFLCSKGQESKLGLALLNVLRDRATETVTVDLFRLHPLSIHQDGAEHLVMSCFTPDECDQKNLIHEAAVLLAATLN